MYILAGLFSVHSFYFISLTLAIFVLTTECKFICHERVLLVSENLLMKLMSKRPFKLTKCTPNVQRFSFPRIILELDMI
jgi:hypothetical protein